MACSSRLSPGSSTANILAGTVSIIVLYNMFSQVVGEGVLEKKRRIHRIFHFGEERGVDGNPRIEKIQCFFPIFFG